MASSVLCVSFYFFLIHNNHYIIHGFFHSCAQCFRSFPEGIFYEFEGRKYCEHDFQMLFAPCCGRCGKNVFPFNVVLFAKLLIAKS